MIKAIQGSVARALVGNGSPYLGLRMRFDGPDYSNQGLDFRILS